MDGDPTGVADLARSSAPLVVRRHLRCGWWTLLVFLTLGIGLEVMHGLKLGWYLDVENETRRLLWTLAHAHGTLLALVHLGFAFTLRLLDAPLPGLKLASWSLVGASLFLPGGFFLGGVWIYAGDPGLGVLLVPVGALFLLVAVLAAASWTLRQAGSA